jgi:hypothetical protein
MPRVTDLRYPTPSINFQDSNLECIFTNEKWHEKVGGAPRARETKVTESGKINVAAWGSFVQVFHA